jgi:predicted MFS family arabinose efflux permease
MLSMPRSIYWLMLSQGLLLTGNAMLVSVNGLVGLMLAPDPHLATLPVTCFVLGGALSTLPISLLMQRRGRAFGFAVGCLAAMIGATLTALAISAGSFALLCLGTAVIGCYNASGQYLRFAAVDLSPPQRRAQAISLVLSGGLLGAFLGPALSRATIHALGTAYLATYLSLIVLALLVFLVTRAVRFPPLPVAATREQSRTGVKLSALLKRPGFLLAVLASACAWATMNLLMTATPLAMQYCGYPFADAAWTLQWHMLGMYLPMLFSGRVIQRLGPLPVIAIGALAIVGCSVVALSGNSVNHFVLALVLLGIGWSFLFSAGSTLLTSQYSEAEKGLAQGIHDAVMFSSMALSSVLAGAAVAGPGWAHLQWLALSVMGLLLVGLLVLGALMRRNTRTQVALS